MNLHPVPSHKRFRISELCELTKGSYPTLRTQPGDFPLVVTADFRRSADGWDIAGPAVCIPLISSTGHNGDTDVRAIAELAEAESAHAQAVCQELGLPLAVIHTPTEKSVTDAIKRIAL